MVQTERLTQFKAKLVAAEERRNVLKEELTKKHQQFTEMNRRHEEVVQLAALDTQSNELVKFIFDKVSTQGFEFLEKNLVNQSLAAVWEDEHYELKLKTGSRGSERTVEFHFNNGEVEDLLTNNGRGVKGIIAFIFRIYFILKYGLRRVVFLDESMSELHETALHNFLDYLRLIIDTYGFKILWVSHDRELGEFATHHYEISKGRLFVRK